MDTQDNPPSTPSSPGPPQPNRHERRRLAALQRREGGPGLAKPKGMKVLSSGPHDPLPEPTDPMFTLLQNITVWAVEGVNEDGTFLAFRAQFKNGSAVVILDHMDELHAEEVVRAAMQNRAERGFIGMIVPCMREGKMQLDAQRNTLRARDMDKAAAIATNAVINKFNKFKEQEARDTANRTQPEPVLSSGDAHPAAGDPLLVDGAAAPDGIGAEFPAGTEPPASPGAGEPAAPTPDAEPVQ